MPRRRICIGRWSMRPLQCWRKKGIALALQILFTQGNREKSVEEDYGTLSMVMDCRALIQEGLSVATAAFTSMLNRKLLEADAATRAGAVKKESDAFGYVFAPIEEPMPTVKLAAGFEVSLRTMFRGQPCQSRYGRIENATYPISKKCALSAVSAGVDQRRGAQGNHMDQHR